MRRARQLRARGYNVTFPMLLAAVVTAAIAGVLTPLLAARAHRRQLLDVPNHRSSSLVLTGHSHVWVRRRAAI
jgi:hypothetical protein